ncbi:hypothetical protein V6R21_25925 [Limibacter armeniacum]|uniref:hypothetical protein n=1 Tax=Limibacter armeniacum TaxID=466084 RepID=UPI002FE53132
MKSGFKLKSELENELVFERGSTLLNMVTFNPLKWKSLISISIQDNMISANFDVSTIGQSLTAKEEKLWDTFVENYQQAMQLGVGKIADNRKELRKTKLKSFHYILWAIIGAVLFGIPTGIIGALFEIDSLVGVGTSVGAMSFLMYKIEMDKKSEDQ